MDRERRTVDAMVLIDIGGRIEELIGCFQKVGPGVIAAETIIDALDTETQSQSGIT